MINASAAALLTLESTPEALEKELSLLDEQIRFRAARAEHQYLRSLPLAFYSQVGENSSLTPIGEKLRDRLSMLGYEVEVYLGMFPCITVRW